MSQYNQTKCLIIIAMNKIDFDNLLESDYLLGTSDRASSGSKEFSKSQAQEIRIINVRT